MSLRHSVTYHFEFTVAQNRSCVAKTPARNGSLRMNAGHERLEAPRPEPQPSVYSCFSCVGATTCCFSDSEIGCRGDPYLNMIVPILSASMVWIAAGQLVSAFALLSKLFVRYSVSPLLPPAAQTQTRTPSQTSTPLPGTVRER
jgi:hypothetical protein